MDSYCRRLPGNPCQGSSSLPGGVTQDPSGQGLPTTQKMQRSELGERSETIFSLEEILQRIQIAESSMKFQAQSPQANKSYHGDEQRTHFQDGLFQAPDLSESRDSESLDLLQFDIPDLKILTPLLKEYKETMNFIRRFMPRSTSPNGSKPDPRELSRHSRLIDGWIDIERDPAAQGTLIHRILSNSGIRRLLNRWFPIEALHSTVFPPSPPSRPNARTLLSLPVEILSEIVDQRVLDDQDRMRFGATCTRAMSIALPVLYKYAMVRYPIKRRPLNQNLRIVGHMIRELVIHVPRDVDPVRDERDYICPFEIFDTMNNLTALTIYFDAQASPNELLNLLRYFLTTKDRLVHITLDVIELRHPLAAYEPRIVYDTSRAINRLRASGGFTTGARLRELSFCMQQSPTDSTADSFCQIFTGYCREAKHLRIIPLLRLGQTLDLRPYRSGKLDHLQWVVRDGMTDSIYTPALHAAVDPRTIKLGRIFTYANPQFIVDNMVGCRDPKNEYPLPSLILLWFECVRTVPRMQSLAHNPALQRDFHAAAEQIFRGAPTLFTITCAERVDGFNYEFRVFRMSDGSGHLVQSRFQ